MGEAGPGCCGNFAKCILIIFNIIFWIAGAIVLGVGVWMLTDHNALSILNVATQHLQNSDALMRVAAYTLIAVGAVAFITGFLGCCGAMSNNTCMLCMYAFILVILVVLQFCAGIFILAFRNKIYDGVGKSLNDTITSKYGTPKNKVLTDGVDVMQKELKCCGSHGFADWENSAWHNTNKTYKVPASCCVFENGAVKDIKCQKAPRAGITYLKGCEQKLKDWVKSHANVIMGVAFGLMGVQILGIILACCLRKRLKNQYQHV